MLNLAVIIASTRPGRVGPQIASWFLEQAAEFDERGEQIEQLGERTRARFFLLMSLGR